MPKRPVLALLAVLLVVPAATAATAEFKPEQVRLKAADVKLAKKVTLRRTDVGQHWRGMPVGGSSDGSEFATCPGFDLDLSAFTITGRASSAFQHPTGATVASSIEVFASKAQAAADFKAAVDHPLFPTCVRAAYQRGLAAGTPGVSIEVGQPQRLRLSRIGQQVFGVRFVMKASVGRTSVDLYFDLVGVQKGRSVASLAFLTPQQPYTAQAGVARKLAARMR